jgi:predicted Ser/Thr protein kinase
MRSKLRAIMQIKTEKKNKEKEDIKKEVKVLKMLNEDFDPELYVKENSNDDISE